MLPADYVPRARATGMDGVGTDTPYWTPERLANTARYQAHVYRWAAQIADRRGCKRVLDAGCGVGVKLDAVLAAPGRELWGVDQPSAVELARRHAPGARYWGADLESDAMGSGGPGGLFDLVVCADVVEHLEDPAVLLGFIRGCMGAGSLALISTPDRDRLRGRGCRVSPKPDHVREWARGEFLAYLGSEGFRVVESRVMPQDEAPVGRLRWADMLFRARLRATSPLACHAVLCRLGTP
jgi:SAM-dependent methyltransferase